MSHHQLLRDLFDETSTLLRETPVTSDLEVSNEDKLRMYGLYKQVTVGVCTHTAPPSMLFSPVNRAKYEAWRSYQALSQEEAMLKYLKLASSKDNWLGRKIRGLLEEYEQQQQQEMEFARASNEPPLHEKANVLDEGKRRTPATKSCMLLNPVPPPPQTDLPLLERLFGLRSLLPRGQLDISYKQLADAFIRCLETASTPKIKARQDEIASTWGLSSSNVVVGLSVRSLLDLYLRTKKFPPGSQIIVVPPINIPSMLTILEHHQLTVVGVDLPASFVQDQILRVDVPQVKQAVNRETVAIMVVHPFGIETTTEKDMQDLRALADQCGLEIIEDCAECYSGANSMKRPYADLALFSFGTIKTATALGGGVAILKHSSEKMHRLHQSLYEPQSQFEYMCKVVKAAIFRLIADLPMVYGMLLIICRFFQINFDQIVSSSTRSFLSKQNDFMKQIRRRPSLALVSTISLRVRHFNETAERHKQKVQRCETLTSLLKDASSVQWPSAMITNQWWLAPIIVKSPVETSQYLLDLGYDVPRGLSQLQAINSCPRALQLMQSILYLPIASRDMSVLDIKKLAYAIEKATDHTHDSSNRQVRPKVGTFVYVVCISSPILIACALSGSGRALVIAMQVVMAAISLKLSFDALLTYFFADLYLESSSSFAQHNPIIREVFEERKSSNNVNLEQINALKVVSLSACDSDRKPSLVLTGVTGFLGTSILRELLTNDTLMASMDQIVLITRPKKGKSSVCRINELLNQDVFSFLSGDVRNQRITVLEGDTSKSNAGINAKDMATLRNELKIHSVINCAASVGFRQSLEEAAAANITSALYLQQLSQRLSAQFVHISTAFVHGGQTGTQEVPLPEKLFCLKKFDANRIYRSMLGNQMYANLAMSTLDFPNTYTFSKCICEHLLLRRSREDLTIIRPSIIGPALNVPFEGWGGQKPSTVVAAACLYLKFPLSIWCFGAYPAAVIPVDVVARFVVAKTVVRGNDSLCQRTDDRSRCSSASSTDFENISPVAEVESIPSECSSEERSSNHRADNSSTVILTAAWNKDSPTASTFSWFDYATSVPHLGTVLGCFTRCTAYLGFAISLTILPSLKLKPKTFARMYRVLLQVPFSNVVRLLKRTARFDLSKLLSKLEVLLDLPVLFYPFMNNSFVFESNISAPSDLDGNRYMFSCVASAHRFLYENDSRHSKTNVLKGKPRDTSTLLVGGLNHRLLTSDLCWALTQPRGNFLIRLVGYIFIKVLRSSTNSVSVDVESFSAIARNMQTSEGEVCIVLAPTHRSFYDFILISFIAFSLPELKIQIPFIAAAQEFSSLPVLGWLMEHAQAFFVKRGQGIDDNLSDQLRTIKNTSMKNGKCIEVFIEGSRSRDRRFLKGKTGFLRSLEQTGGDHLVVPICISYEKIPEQSTLVDEGSSGLKKGLTTSGLLTWLWKTLKGELPIGSIHIRAADPILLTTRSTVDFCGIVTEIQMKQQAMILISSYHIHAAEYTLSLERSLVTEALEELGCTFWPTECCRGGMDPPLPLSPSEGWSIVMQFGHLIAPKLKRSHSHWAEWLSPLESTHEEEENNVQSVAGLVQAFERLFDETESAIEAAIGELNRMVICPLSVSHVVQIAQKHQKRELPISLLFARASMRVCDNNPPVVDSKIVPRVHDFNVENEFEQLGYWGFKDSKFQVRPDSGGKPNVVMSGQRYAVSGKCLKRLIPFIEAETKIDIDVYREPALEVTGLVVDDCDFSVDDIELLRKMVARISTSSNTRSRHGTGHSQEEAYHLRRDGKLRVPDIVAWPSSNNEVQSLVEAAARNGWNLIPHGGGTNVSHATRCPSKAIDPRPIISVDMTDMKRILWVNEEDGVAHVEAGITGRELVDEMKRRGYTMGHEPDSLEFSTLGGWIATKASGMKRSKYGNIEDIVVDIQVSGATGMFGRREKDSDVAAASRESRGPDLLSFFFGSEGCLGIITSAVIKIWPLPAMLSYESVLLRDFNTGLDFVRHIAKLGPLMPASVRLLDNAHFRLGQALREESTYLEVLAKTAIQFLSPILGPLPSEQDACACTIQFEGNADQIREQRKQVKALVMQHGGFLLGPHYGRSGYELTFVIAYLRDFALSYNFLGDSFETFAPWSKMGQLIGTVKKTIKDEHKRRCLPGEVFVGSRVTQLYHDGACVYFYMCMYCGSLSNASAVFAEIEHAAREEILKHGGSLSHHHGVGKIRSAYLKDLDSKPVKEGFHAIKTGLDPSNIFGARNGVFADCP